MKLSDIWAITKVWKRKKKSSHWEFHPAVRTGDQRTLGERSADAMRHGMGSWPFVFSFITFMFVWMGYNASTNKAFDPFPYILLNLILSTLAGLQGAILLIAAKRADRISAELASYHLEVSETANDQLRELNLLISDIHHIMAELDYMKNVSKTDKIPTTKIKE
jgi:uncharacterized membrane protein